MKCEVGDWVKVRYGRNIIGEVVHIYKSSLSETYLIEYEGEWEFEPDGLVTHTYPIRDDRAYIWIHENGEIDKGMADTEIARKLYPNAEEYNGVLFV